LKEVDEILGQGKSEQQIIDAFVTEYGTTVYVEPPKKGFGLVAWLMPVFYSVLGLGLVVFVVRKWAVRSPSAPAAASGANVPNEALERARAQRRRIPRTEDHVCGADNGCAIRSAGLGGIGRVRCASGGSVSVRVLYPSGRVGPRAPPDEAGPTS
jgi:hypothetical protein